MPSDFQVRYPFPFSTKERRHKVLHERKCAGSDEMNDKKVKDRTKEKLGSEKTTQKEQRDMKKRGFRKCKKCDEWMEGREED